MLAIVGAIGLTRIEFTVAIQSLNVFSSLCTAAARSTHVPVCSSVAVAGGAAIDIDISGYEYVRIDIYTTCSSVVAVLGDLFLAT